MQEVNRTISHYYPKVLSAMAVIRLRLLLFSIQYNITTKFIIIIIIYLFYVT